MRYFEHYKKMISVIAMDAAVNGQALRPLGEGGRNVYT